jgi:transcriptional regulator with GAF, ATPase, and Fis domain
MHSNVTDLVSSQEKLKQALTEVKRLKDRLQAESEYLQDEIKTKDNLDEIVGHSRVMATTLHKVEMVATTDSTVLLLGETGTGKELLARALHFRSKRNPRPLIKVDCGTLPPGLIERQLFGHEKGAFTGAYEKKMGRFELADGGTIFLDEIGELPMELQSKLLRVLEDGTFQRLGSKREKKVDVRVIAASNRDLRDEMRAGRFRPDLYYRLGVFVIESPPLRDRREDISLLASFLLSKYAAAMGKTIHSIDGASLDALVTYDWPGNIRELRNVIERSVILCSSDTLVVEDTFGKHEVQPETERGGLNQDLEGVERARILEALQVSGWKIKGKDNAASRLGLRPSTLRSKMKKLGIIRTDSPTNTFTARALSRKQTG